MLTISGLYMMFLDGQSFDEAFGCFMLTSVALPLAQVLPRSQLISPSKTWFFGIYLNCRQQKCLENQYLPHSESKSYQINSIKSLLIKIFPSTPNAHFNSFDNLQLRFNFIFSEEIIQSSRLLHRKSNCYEPSPSPLLV